MKNTINKSITWNFANEDETSETFNPRITAFVNYRHQWFIEISNPNDNEATAFTVLDLETAKDFAKHILNEIKVCEKSNKLNTL